MIGQWDYFVHGSIFTQLKTVLMPCNSVQVDLCSTWWMEALRTSTVRGMEGDLCKRIKDELSSTDMELGSIGRFAFVVLRLAIKWNFC